MYCSLGTVGVQSLVDGNDENRREEGFLKRFRNWFLKWKPWEWNVS